MCNKLLNINIKITIIQLIFIFVIKLIKLFDYNRSTFLIINDNYP